MNLIESISKKTLLADGAMGTMLHARGIGFDKCFDELNLTNPVAVAEIHREYIEAGAQLIITNTFSANRFKLSKHGLQDDMAEINRAGVELARRVVSASYQDVLIAGDVGPLGVRIALLTKQKHRLVINVMGRGFAITGLVIILNTPKICSLPTEMNIGSRGIRFVLIVIRTFCAVVVTPVALSITPNL